MFGCLSFLSASISISNRSRKPSSSARCGFSTLTAANSPVSTLHALEHGAHAAAADAIADFVWSKSIELHGFAQRRIEQLLDSIYCSQTRTCSTSTVEAGTQGGLRLSEFVNLPADTNQARGIAQYAIDFVGGKFPATALSERSGRGWNSFTSIAWPAAYRPWPAAAMPRRVLRQEALEYRSNRQRRARAALAPKCE